jgi:hypothetical protein
MEWKDMIAEDLKTRVPPRVFERGAELYRQGNIVEVCRIGPVWAGRVAGYGGVYKARLWNGSSGMEGECNCAYPGFCKHLVALALEMSNHGGRFPDIGAKVKSVTEDVGGLPALLEKLIGKDPFNFLEVLATADRKQPEFLYHRSLINLVRNLFVRPALNQRDAELLWDRLTETLVRIKSEITAGNPGLAEVLPPLFNGVIAEYENYRNDILLEYLVDLLALIATVPRFLDPENLRPLLKVLLDASINPRVWETAPEIRKTVAEFLKRDPDYLGEYWISSLRTAETETTIRLFAAYELLTALPEELTGKYAPRIQELETALIQSEEGRLWLIDRLTENHPGKAKRLARAGLSAAAPGQKGVFRERLIRLHQAQGEYRQAASLSFAQFCETPDLEEYLRLKNLLAGRHLRDWEGYLRQMRRLAETRGMEELFLQIAFDVGDTATLIPVLEVMGPEDPHLTLFARKLAERCFPAMGSFYWLIVTKLLTRGEAGDADLAIGVSLRLRAYCRAGGYQQLWEVFRARIREQFPEITGRMRRLGEVLRE